MSQGCHPLRVVWFNVRYTLNLQKVWVAIYTLTLIRFLVNLNVVRV